VKIVFAAKKRYVWTGVGGTNSNPEKIGWVTKRCFLCHVFTVAISLELAKGCLRKLVFVKTSLRSPE
jgi:hypothetical protein